MKKALNILFLVLVSSLAPAVAQDYGNQPQTDESQTRLDRDRIAVIGCLQQGTSPDTYVLTHAVPAKTGSVQREEGDQQQADRMADDRSRTEPDDRSTTAQDRDQADQPDQTGQEPNSPDPSELARTQDNYLLVPDSTVDLKDHIGHRVEITGEMVEPGSASDESQEPDSGRMSGDQNRPEIRVTSIRHIAKTCQ